MIDEFLISRVLSNLIGDNFLENNHELWIKLQTAIDFVPYEYTIPAIRYYLEYMKDNYETVIDFSYIVRDNGRAVGMCTMQIRKQKEQWYIGSNFGEIIPPILCKDISDKVRKRALRQCASIITQLSSELNVNTIKFRMQTYNKGIDYWYSLWMEYGASIFSISHVCFTDLTLPLEQIHKAFRRRYVDYIKESLRLYKTTIVNVNDRSAFSAYKNFHHQIAGRITRGIKTWEEQLNALASNNAFLVFIYNNNNEMVGAAYFFLSKDECYYLSGAYNRELFDKPVSHIVQYTAINYCIERGVKLYRLGERCYKGDDDARTEKELSISYFKEGFATNIFILTKMRYDNEP